MTAFTMNRLSASRKKSPLERLSHICLFSLAIAFALASGYPASADPIQIETLEIGDAGNHPDTNNRGAVSQTFRMARFEVTNEQYVAFLRAVATLDDPNGLYNMLMESSDRGGIIRSGSAGAFVYTIKPNFNNKPVGSVSWFDAARFCNWLHNGQPSGLQLPSTTENGAYDMSLPADQIERITSAKWFLPTHNEWYKAAYYDPNNPGADAGGSPDYWLYPTGSDALPAKAIASSTGDVVNPGTNIANYDKGADWNDENGNVTTVGGVLAVSPWGISDLAGNINEMTETLDVPIPANPPAQPDPLPTRTIRGGDFASPGALMMSPEAFAPGLNMLAEGANIGFRVAARAAPTADLNGDGVVNGSDLAVLLVQWGTKGPADLNSDGVVNGSDLAILLVNWTT